MLGICCQVATLIDVELYMIDDIDNIGWKFP